MKCNYIAIAIFKMGVSSITVEMQTDLSIHPDDQFYKLNNVFSNGNKQEVKKDACADQNLNVTIVFSEDSVNLP